VALSDTTILILPGLDGTDLMLGPFRELCASSLEFPAVDALGLVDLPGKSLSVDRAVVCGPCKCRARFQEESRSRLASLARAACFVPGLWLAGCNGDVVVVERGVIVVSSISKAVDKTAFSFASWRVGTVVQRRRCTCDPSSSGLRPNESGQRMLRIRCADRSRARLRLP